MPRRVGNKEAFLAAYRASGSVGKAAATVGIQRGLHYRWRKADPAYDAAFEVAGAEHASKKAAKARKDASRGLSRSVEYDLRLEMRRLRDVIGDIRRRIRALEAKVASGQAEARTRGRKQPAEGDALLDQIARGMANKPFSRLSTAHQEAVRDIAERIKSTPD